MTRNATITIDLADFDAMRDTQKKLEDEIEYLKNEYRDLMSIIEKLAESGKPVSAADWERIKASASYVV